MDNHSNNKHPPVELAAQIKGYTPETADMEAINRMTLRELAPEEVYAWKMVACDDRTDRDGERFTATALESLAKLFVGKPVLQDHDWSASSQCGRIYAGAVETGEDGRRQLVLRAYMIRAADTEARIRAIDAGIIREVSVGCAVASRTCSICGKDYGTCRHRRGEDYGGQRCEIVLDQATDAYEVSFVAVPAQPGARTTKGAEPPEDEMDTLRMRLRIAAAAR